MDYLQGAGQQEEQERANQEFWQKWYSQLNPQAPVAQTPSAGPGMQQAAQNTQQYANQMQPQMTGNVDLGQMRTGIQNRATQNTRAADLNSFLRDLGENRGRMQQQGSGQFGKMNQIGGVNKRLGKMPQERWMQKLYTDEQIQQMWDAYGMGLTPSVNLIGSAAGGLGGSFLAAKLDKTNPKAWNYQDPNKSKL